MSIQDMNNRMKQNRQLLPSKRAKFKKNNRNPIYSKSGGKEKAIFKEFSDFQVRKSIERFRLEAKSEKRLGLIISFSVMALFGIFLVYLLLTTNEKTEINVAKPKELRTTFYYPNPIKWSGKLYEPLEVPKTDYYYVPVVGNFDYANLGKTYDISKHNMVVEYTSNIVFLDKDCKVLRKLMPENGSIQYMMIVPSDKELKPRKIVYRLTQDEPNTYGKIYNLEKHYYYVSDLDGNNLKKITDEEVKSFTWDEGKKEIVFYFSYDKRENEDRHGRFNTEKNEFRWLSSTK